MGNCGLPVRLPTVGYAYSLVFTAAAPAASRPTTATTAPVRRHPAECAGGDGEGHPGQTHEGERGDDAEAQEGDVEEQVGHRVTPSPTIGTSTP